MMKRNSWAVIFSTWPLTIFSQTAPTPPHEVSPAGGTVPAHHVRLMGTGMSQAMTQVLNAGLQRCREAGQFGASLPDSAPVQQLTYDVYYTAHSVTTYKHVTTPQLTVGCTLVTQSHLEIEVLTAAGLCQISPQRHIQRGACRLGSSKLSSPTTPARTTREAPTVTGEAQVAGHVCQQYEEQWALLKSRYCILTATPAKDIQDTFVPAPATWHRHTPGVMLQISTWSETDPKMKILDLSAAQVHTALRIHPSVVMPTEGMEAPSHAP